MKKYILTILLILIINLSAFAQVSTKDTLNAIENGVFGYDYKNEPEIQRVERLEEYMYGEKRTGNVQKRIEALQDDSGIVVDAKKTKKQTSLQNALNDSIGNQMNNNIPQKQKNTNHQNLKEDETVDYPIVDKMEKDLFNQTYKTENIYDRINRLEKTVFQKTSDEDLNSRVDKLASVLRPAGRKAPIQEQTYSKQDIENMFGNNGMRQIDNQTMPFQLAALESDILKHEYVGDNNANRLARLEQKVFNRTFPNDSDIQRLQRILVAYEAKKDSYKYENNRKMQNMATMSQIGGILLMILAMIL